MKKNPSPLSARQHVHSDPLSRLPFVDLPGNANINVPSVAELEAKSFSFWIVCKTVIKLVNNATKRVTIYEGI
jgi:hypothetical protein